MAEDILDEPEVKTEEEILYSKLSYFNAVVAIGFFLHLIIEARDTTARVSVVELVGTLMFCLIGFLFLFIGIARGEPANWFRQAGIILNLFLFTLLIGFALVFSLIPL